MIRIENLQFSYPGGEFTLRVGELSVETGSTVAMVGPSGSGKTTLLHLAAGIRAPSQGRVTVKDVDVTALRETARRDFRVQHIGLVFQEFELLEYLSVLDNVLLPYRISAALQLNGGVRDRASALLRGVGVGDKRRRLATRLSHGEKQRVAVCRALLTQPALVLADEPTGNLDPDNRDRVLDILFDDARKRGTTLVTVTHDHELLGRFDRVIDLKTLQPAPA